MKFSIENGIHEMQTYLLKIIMHFYKSEHVWNIKI